MVSTDRIPISELSTWAANGPFPIEMVYKARQSGPQALSLHNESVKEIQKIIKECHDEGKRFRGYGSLWSLNDIAFNGSRLHSNYEMDMRMQIQPDQMHASSTITHDNVVFAQCGTTIKQLSAFLESVDKSIIVSGGSNGQTIAGAISTGVHGGAFNRQCISDYVRGLHIIRGPNPEDRVYLERKGERVLNDDFINSIDSRLIDDEDIFNAAMIGLGSFGFIAGVVLEVEKRYSYKRYAREIQFDDAIKLLETLDFENSNFKIPEEVDANNKPKIPYHFKPYINQYTKNCVAEVIYQVDYIQTEKPVFEVVDELHPDIFWLMHWAMQKTEGSIVKLMSGLLQNNVFPNPKKETKPKIGTIGEIFSTTEFMQPAFSWAICVDNSNVADAMETFTRVFDISKVPGLTAIRLIKQSRATIGFAKFPLTAVIGMDGIQWTPDGRMWPREAMENEIIKAFARRPYEFTLHWGKNADWGYTGLIDMMYRDKDDEWIKARSRFLTYEMADLFSNDFIRRVGLSGYLRNEAVV